MLWELGEFRVDEQLFEVRRDGRRLELAHQPLCLLIYLARNAPRAVPSGELQGALWPGLAVTESSLRQVVRALRHGLGADGAKRIVSVRGYGYRLDGPVRSLRPRAERAAAAPAGERAPPPRPFFGREAELGVLRAAAGQAAEGRGQLVMVAGPPGIGKTRLAQQLAAVVAPAMRLVWGCCREDRGSPPLWPWPEVVRGVLGAREEDGGPELGVFGAGLGALFPSLAPSLAPPAQSALDSAARRPRLFAAVADAVRRRARAGPLLVVLDDLHVAAEPALLLLAALARELGSCRALVIGTYRDEELRWNPRVAESVRALSAAAGIRVVLGGLGVEAVGAYLEAAAGRAVGAEVVARIHALGGGNPLFTRELARLCGEALCDEAVSLARLAGPATPLRDAVRRHAHPLSPCARELVSAAAVLGTEAALPVLREMLGWPEAELGRHAAAAAAAGLLAELRPGWLRFGHALFRASLCQELPASERRRLHRKAGAALEALGRGCDPAFAAEIAHHFAQCLPDADAARRAVHYLGKAADAAVAATAYEEACAHCRAALSILDAEGTRDERWAHLTAVLAEAERLAGASLRKDCPHPP